MEKSKGPSRDEWHTVYTFLAPNDAGQMRLVGAQRVRQKGAKTPKPRVFIDLLAQATYRTLYVIGGLVDPAINVARSLTIWSALVLGFVFGGFVLAGAAGQGAIGLPLMLVLVVGLGMMTLLIGMTATAGRRSSPIVQVPDWLQDDAA